MWYFKMWFKRGFWTATGGGGGPSLVFDGGFNAGTRVERGRANAGLTTGEAWVALDVKVILPPPCILNYSTRNIQGCVRMT
jgi:hypothetical protein